MHFKNSFLSKKNRDRKSSIYLGDLWLRKWCVIFYERVWMCTGQKCELLICICNWCVFSIYVCVSFWVRMPSNQECEFINVWGWKRLITHNWSRCFKEFSAISINVLIFFVQRKDGGKEDQGSSSFFWLSKFLAACSRFWDRGGAYLFINLLVVGKGRLASVRTETLLWGVVWPSRWSVCLI